MFDEYATINRDFIQTEKKNAKFSCISFKIIDAIYIAQFPKQILHKVIKKWVPDLQMVSKTNHTTITNTTIVERNEFLFYKKKSEKKRVNAIINRFAYSHNNTTQSFILFHNRHLNVNTRHNNRTRLNHNIMTGKKCFRFLVFFFFFIAQIKSVHVQNDLCY